MEQMSTYSPVLILGCEYVVRLSTILYKVQFAFLEVSVS